MCSRIWTPASTKSSSVQLERLQAALDRADAVVIGAGAGLSTAAGFTYEGERFERYFGDFKVKYGFRDMYSGGFYPFDSPEEHWAYWSRYIWVNRYMDPPKPVYENLLELVGDKDYFVLTTNVDHQFWKAGFKDEDIFATQGDYGLIQCAKAKEFQIRTSQRAEFRFPEGRGKHPFPRSAETTEGFGENMPAAVKIRKKR